MADTAAHLVDHVLPRGPYRQWLFTVPKRLRLLLARDPAWTSWVGNLAVRAIGAWQRRVARAHGGGSPLDDVGLGVAVHDDGTPRVIGSFEGQITFDLGLPSPVSLMGESEDIFLSNFDADGHALQAKTVGTGPTRLAAAFAVAPDGNVSIAGTFDGTSTFGHGEPSAVTLMGTVANNQYVARYDICP
jgi:hypothetical protein